MGQKEIEVYEIKKPNKKPVFQLGRLYVFNEEDEDGELTIIGKLIGKNEGEDTLTFGNQYEIENEKFVTDQSSTCVSAYTRNCEKQQRTKPSRLKRLTPNGLRKRRKRRKRRSSQSSRPSTRCL